MTNVISKVHANSREKMSRNWDQCCLRIGCWSTLKLIGSNCCLTSVDIFLFHFIHSFISFTIRVKRLCKKNPIIYFCLPLVDLISYHPEDFACIVYLGKHFWNLMQKVCFECCIYKTCMRWHNTPLAQYSTLVQNRMIINALQIIQFEPNFI